MKKLLLALCAALVLAMVPACGHKDRAYKSSSSKSSKTRVVKRSEPKTIDAKPAKKKKTASVRERVDEASVSTTSSPAETVVVD